jgi:2-polyprenyl-3-methyl-5-hydroxy-6-metoxy-1,4-benzoquinol methylase
MFALWASQKLMNQRCWCGNLDLKDFSPEYFRCDDCSTLVSKSIPAADITAVADEDADFYGKKYWLGHQVEELGLASIEQRSRSDLLDRCGLWLGKLLEFSLPPARLLEIGCSHGGFLALAQLAGFLATGIELSPWVVEFARKSFGVNVLTGPIERADFEVGSFDVICMFDVLEHLQDPARTLRACARALSPNGILLAQTPQYPAQVDLSILNDHRHPFLQMMLPTEHFFLFSDASVRRLFREAGFSSCEFVPAPFAHYDMMLAAGRGPLPKNSGSAVSEALERSAGGRVIQAVLSLLRDKTNREAQHQELLSHFVQAKQDIEGLQDIEREGIQGKVQLAGKVGCLEKWLRQAYTERNELRHWAGVRSVVKQSSRLIVSEMKRRLRPLGARSKQEAIRVCVDLMGLPAMGEYGGLTLAAMDSLEKLRGAARFEFIFTAAEPSYDAVSTLFRSGDSVILISDDSRKSNYDAAQIEVLQSLTAAKLKEHRTDVYYAPFGDIPAVARDFKTVCCVQDLVHRDCPELVLPERLRNRESTISNTLDLADKVQVPSEYVRQRLLEAYPIRAEKTFVTYFPLENGARSKRPKNSRTRPYFFCPDGYFSGASIATMLFAYKRYLDFAGETGWTLLFAWHGEDRLRQVRNLAESLGLGGAVEIESDLGRESFRTGLQEAGALFYPVLHEGTGIPVFQAFQYAVPVISSSVNSLPEIAGDAALYVDPYSSKAITRALQEVSSSPETRLRLADLGRKQIKRFNPEEEAEKLANIFTALVEGK